MRNYQMCINGEWMASSHGKTYLAINPAKDAPFGALPIGTREDARRAIAAAQAAQPGLAKMSAWERSALCLRIAEAIEKRRDAFMQILSEELGKPFYAEVPYEVDEVPLLYRNAAEHVKWLEGTTIPVQDANKRVVTFRQPRGVYAVLSPSNFPTHIASQYISAALATGNTVVWSPAQAAAASCTVLMEALIAAGIPKGAVNLVIGPGAEVGDELASNPGVHGVAITGGSATGRRVAERAAGKSLLMELGGNGPTILLEDADIQAAAPKLVSAAFFHAGQVCSATERVLVHESRKQELVEAVLKLTSQVRLGDPLDKATTMGPLTSLAVVEKMQRHVDDAKAKGAHIRMGGKQPKGLSRYYYEPTVLTDFTRDSLVNLEETFGPILPIASFQTDEEALAMINACDLGLVSSVWTRDLNQAWKWAEQLRSGLTVVNDFTNYWEIHIPFGGMACNRSGIGRLGGRHTMMEMTEVKTIAFHIQ